MKRIFFYIFVVLTVLNFVCKTVIFITYDKVEGRIVGYDGFTNKYVRTSRHTGKEVTSYEHVKTPIVEFELDGITRRLTMEKWGYISTFNLNDNVTILADKKRKHFEMNGFFQFWITFRDLFWGILILIFGSMFLGIVLPERKRAPRVWK